MKIDNILLLVYNSTRPVGEKERNPLRTKILYVRNRRVVAFVTVIVIDRRFARKVVIAYLQSGEARLKIE